VCSAASLNKEKKMENGLTVSFATLFITIIISYFIAFLVKIMVVLLDKFSKPVVVVESTISTVVESSDESEIAAVIAIANSRK
jgi:Na+-transporting methylmalonyl-CoA/oxaloacetate decarboxylase gamma subunit